MDLEVSLLLERLAVFSNDEISLTHIVSFFGMNLQNCPDDKRILGGIFADHLSDQFSIYQWITIDEAAEAFFDLIDEN